MRKVENVAIRLRDDKVGIVDGYGFDCNCGSGFSVPLCVHRNLKQVKGNEWVVTDINTGYAIAWGSTRKAAIEKYGQLRERFVTQYVLSNEHYPRKQSSTNWYEYMTDRFTELKECM